MAAELPGFFPVQEEPPAIENPTPPNFISWNADSDLDVRFTWPVLSDGTPDAYTLIQSRRRRRRQRRHHPEEAAADLQAGIAEWYEPAQGCRGLSAKPRRRGAGAADGGCSSSRRSSSTSGSWRSRC